MTLNNFFKTRLWSNNPSFVQLLGLCPVLAMTTSVVNALGLGVCTTFILIITNTIISIFKHIIPKNIRIPIFMLIVSSTVTCVEMILHAYQFNLYKSLGVFIPLIVTNCIVIRRAESIAYKNSILVSFFDGLLTGLGSTLAMFFIGLIREMLGHGTLFFESNKIFNFLETNDFFTILNKNMLIILAVSPPGGFLILGFLIAFKNYLDKIKKKKKF
ncbi:electron transport complex subunit E [Buchnera aphidicola]|uniref:Ion-translocating oxidoreductase complex subunit E n=1 Tax=Buchnera aphidicola (Aphis gossypii) TaxID=98785 RepID=A0A5J6Z9A1_9GAMM|nr:electron transport complex subunit E [Buchnera aphidicola]QFQ31964.1 electron transport complex subunit E [Buchnera aphidicola (Aphis gossypii)]UPT14494.1 electron transport complex subunit E [Buchnera aphidicola (Aphis gossypii)]